MAEPPESPVTGAVRSLEVRWIFPGQLEAAVAGWFGRFPAETESRQDIYLLDPPLRGLSVKIRGGGALEVKVYRGSPGILEVADRARGRMEAWQEWSFPLGPPSPGSGDPPGWTPVAKAATGPAHLLRSELQATAGLVFAQALPGGVQPGTDQSRSYAQWLGQRPGADTDSRA